MKLQKKRLNTKNCGFIMADFLFSFTMIISIGIFIFGLTFSLATIEIAQYIVWSTARTYAAGNFDEPSAKLQARDKFKNLTAQFPLLTGNGADSPWFEMSDTDLIIGDLAVLDSDFNISTEDKRNNFRQPWIGVRAKINLKLFSSLQLPFLGGVAENKDLFNFPVRAFIIRSPSTIECRNFFYRDRYVQGIRKLENNQLAPGPDTAGTLPTSLLTDGWGEDNGC